MIDRVIVTRPIVGICHMQVCAVTDATDDEILATANRLNPSGTERGWCRVIRQPSGHDSTTTAPVACGDDAERLHFLVVC